MNALLRIEVDRGPHSDDDFYWHFDVSFKKLGRHIAADHCSSRLPQAAAVLRLRLCDLGVGPITY